MKLSIANSKYGKDNVRTAKELSCDEGSSSIALNYLPNDNNGKPFTTRQVDAMIFAE